MENINNGLQKSDTPSNTIPAQAVSRTFQIIIGMILSVFSGFLVLSAMMILVAIISGKPGIPIDTWLFIAIMLLIGIGMGIMAYRLLTNRGATHGGGVLSPVGYTILGVIFIGMSIWIGVIAKIKSFDDGLIGIGFPLILASWCFHAARLRRNK